MDGQLVSAILAGVASVGGQNRSTLSIGELAFVTT
jgi:hypothetical protein